MARRAEARKYQASLVRLRAQVAACSERKFHAPTGKGHPDDMAVGDGLFTACLQKASAEPLRWSDRQSPDFDVPDRFSSWSCRSRPSHDAKSKIVTSRKSPRILDDLALRRSTQSGLQKFSNGRSPRTAFIMAQTLLQNSSISTATKSQRINVKAFLTYLVNLSRYN